MKDLNLARVFYLQQKYPEALVLLEALIRRMPLPSDALVLYVRCLKDSGEESQARQVYAETVDADPDAAVAELDAAFGMGE